MENKLAMSNAAVFISKGFEAINHQVLAWQAHKYFHINHQ